MRIVPVPILSGKSWDDAVETLGHRQRELTLLPLASLSVDPKTCALRHEDRTFGMTQLAARQLASRLGITPGYVLKIDNEIAATNFNHFMRNATGSTQMVVEDDQNVVGFLGERTVPVPVDTLVEQAAEKLGKEGYEIQEWHYDSTGATFRLATDKLQVAPRKGDIIRFGIDLLNRENTETGLSTRAVAYRLVCLNGATAPEPTGLAKQMRREGWRDPSARIELAFTAARGALDIINDVREHLAALPQADLDWFDDYDQNVTLIHSALAHIDGQPIRNGKLAQTVVETLSDEEHTGYGLYNALTRIGRDSLDVTRRSLFEHAGFQLALRPEHPLQALHEAAEVLFAK